MHRQWQRRIQPAEQKRDMLGHTGSLLLPLLLLPVRVRSVIQTRLPMKRVLLKAVVFVVLRG